MVKKDVMKGTVTICSVIKGHMAWGRKNMKKRHTNNDRCPNGMIVLRPYVSESLPKMGLSKNSANAEKEASRPRKEARATGDLKMREAALALVVNKGTRAEVSHGKAVAVVLLLVF